MTSSPAAASQVASHAELERAMSAVAAPFRDEPIVGVAFSGGVDSAVLLALLARAFGPGRVIALLGVSPSLAASERAGAHRTARAIGVAVEEVITDELSRAAYVENGADRCYHCKSELFTRIDEGVAPRLGLTAIAYGENADDVRRLDRPGGRAAIEHGVRRPLADAGLGKEQVRALARAMGLECADKPAAPCLASRVPHRTAVTVQLLSKVERAEAALHRLGFRECRVRHHGSIARIEVPQSEFGALVSESVRRRLVEMVHDAGYDHVTLDLAGLQFGAFTAAELKFSHA